MTSLSHWQKRIIAAYQVAPYLPIGTALARTLARQTLILGFWYTRFYRQRKQRRVPTGGPQFVAFFAPPFFAVCVVVARADGGCCFARPSGRCVSRPPVRRTRATPSHWRGNRKRGVCRCTRATPTTGGATANAVCVVVRA
jgi:hypothetical protein